MGSGIELSGKICNSPSRLLSISLWSAILGSLNNVFWLSELDSSVALRLFSTSFTSGSAIERLGNGVSLLASVASIPVATTETRIIPCNSSSIVDPTIILASGSTSSLIRLAASSNSNNVRS